MEIIRTAAQMQQVAREARSGPIGLVPTMGALHEGHFSLVRAARARCAPVVVSIFVNPTQFGPAEDLARYPRPFDADCAALASLGVDCVFAPTPEEMYPRGYCSAVVVERLGDRLEGRVRPGHFRGVTTVVLSLLNLVQPRLAFFGRKDAQQLRIVRQMVADLHVDTEIVACPIVRESDGLAYSSRNAYLTPPERRAATVLSRSLRAAGRAIDEGERDACRLLNETRRIIGTERLATLDYAELVDAETLEAVDRLERPALLLLAAVVGSTRLIDNAQIDTWHGRFTVVV
ncbi:MAG TPA: pantoate--beta-alanine ligase [Vicinamibacterales bacterium]|nr:pantoate--beta-alanine ligase [Vicinamibacterales bacterium]